MNKKYKYKELPIQLSISELDEMIYKVNHYEFEYREDLHDLLLKCNITKHNIYKRLELLNVLYPVYLTKEQYIEQMAYIINNAKQDTLKYERLNISYILPILGTIYPYLTSQKSMILLTRILQHHNAFDNRAARFLAGQIPFVDKEEKYINEFYSTLNLINTKDGHLVKLINKANDYLEGKTKQRFKGVETRGRKKKNNIEIESPYIQTTLF